MWVTAARLSTGWTVPVHRLLKFTLESYSEVVVSTRIPELHMFVCPPCDPLFCQRDWNSGPVGINVIQLQSVWKQRNFITDNTAKDTANYELKLTYRALSSCFNGEVKLSLNTTREIFLTLLRDISMVVLNLFSMSNLPLKRLLAMAPHGAMGRPSLVRYGSHSLLGFYR